MIQVASRQIKICFTFNFQEKDNMYCDINEKLINVFQKYSEKKGMELDSLYFLCNGEKIEDFQKTLEQLASSEDKRNMEIIILVFKANLPDDESMINVYFATKFEAQMIPCKKKDKIKDICNKYEKLTNIKPKSRIYKHKGVELDSEKTFDDYDNINGVIFINVIPKSLTLIIFAYLNVLYNVECYKEDKIEDICNDFASKNNIDKKKVIFKHYDNLIDQNKTLNEFLMENDININEIKIDVIDANIPPSPSFLSMHNIKIIVILSISVVIIAGGTVLIILVKPKCDPGYKLIDGKCQKDDIRECNTGYKLIDSECQKDDIRECNTGYKFKDGECLVDYFIKATYVSNTDEKVKLISDDYQLNKINKIIIDDIEEQPTKFHTFKVGGEHTAYFSFSPYKKSSSRGGNGLFNGVVNLLSVEFSDYNENYPDVTFDSMFKNCINLKSVDLSKISLEYNDYSNKGGKDYSSDYFYSMSYMFYNCSSLISLQFPKSKLNPKEMDYSFAYCSSLKSLVMAVGECSNISKAKSMSNTFRNCTSLKSITFFSYNEYEDYSSLFMGCTSLTELYFQLNINNTKKMNNMFTDCSSLTTIRDIFSSKIQFNKITFLTPICLNSSDLIDISEMFLGCSSLTSVDLSALVTNNIRVYKGLFYNCNRLSYIDISSFSHNDLTDSKLSIFNDNIPSYSTVIMNTNFNNRIKSLIPLNLNVKEEIQKCNETTLKSAKTLEIPCFS